MPVRFSPMAGYLIRKHFNFINNGVYRSTSFSPTSEGYNTIGAHIVTPSHYRPGNKKIVLTIALVSSMLKDFPNVYIVFILYKKGIPNEP